MNCGTLVLLSIPFLGLSGCMEAAMQMRGQTVPATLLPRNTSGPEAAPEGSCWAKHITPAVIETITSQKQLSLPVDQAGNLGHPAASYQTETRHVMLNNRYERWFETLCPDLMDTPLVTALQRALQDHDLYQGKIDGLVGPATKASVHRFQRQNGLDSDTLSLRSAVLLALVEDQAP